MPQRTTAPEFVAAPCQETQGDLYDVLILGGGPTGATAGLMVARAGKRSLIIDKASFPRFAIGESFLPRTFSLLQELGLEESLAKLPQVPKLGVEFAIGNETKTTCFGFSQSLLPGGRAFNIARAPFDEMLLNAARDAGAEVRQNATVKNILQLDDDGVRLLVEQADGMVEVRGRYLIDASGQATVVARHLGTRRALTDRHFQKVAYYQHFENVRRPEGVAGGFPFIAMCSEGWFWIIPLDEKKTSVGLVIDAEKARQVGESEKIPANRMLRWGMQRCPIIAERVADAIGPETNLITADFSYSCKPYAGPGYFLAGDAATFLDPIFSTGVCLGMMGGKESARHVLDILAGRNTFQAAAREYTALIENSTSVFFRLIRYYYEQPFRELFLNGQGPLKVHCAVLSILAGHVFPRPPWSLRWRMKFFELCMAIQSKYPLAPRRPRFSLLEGISLPSGLPPG